MDTKFGTNVSNKILLTDTKFQGYSPFRFWVIKGKPTKGVKLPPPRPPTRIKVNNPSDFYLKKYLLNFMLQIFHSFE